MNSGPDIYALVSLGASVATILTVAVSAIKYFRNKKAEESRASENLYLELRDVLDGLNVDKFPENFCEAGIDDYTGKKKKVCFMARTLNHDFYDSLIYSGGINFLDPALQQQVQDAFKRIKTHNKYVDTVLEISDHNNSTIPVRAYRYCEWIENTEKILQKELPKILKKLQIRFKTNRQ